MVDYREQNAKAGYVYIISNIGSFGEDVFKIGMTRRLEPLDRVNELGNASVPFNFDVHAMIFSEDAPKLENALHRAFESAQVNKVNPRKEFFNITLEEMAKVVKENHNKTVEFTKLAAAEEYRKSLKLKQETAS
ncbi:MAG: GIY-YIG nuclease family protein [Bacillaceae bacterium]|nr:GIY-YIG nuclease family protein [Bacillaceae bacterium]